jgi:uncharacterized protein
VHLTVELSGLPAYIGIMLKPHKKSVGWIDKIKAALWPRKGFIRPVKYFGFRIIRLRASPHMIAAGVAAGVASAFTPFIGVHFFVSFAFAWVLRGSMIAAGLATVAAGNPLTYPLIWGATWELGRIMMGHNFGAQHTPNLHALLAHFDLREIWGPVFEPMLLGSIPLALGLGLLAYLLAYKGTDVFQKRKAARLEARASHLESRRKAAGDLL